MKRAALLLRPAGPAALAPPALLLSPAGPASLATQRGTPRINGGLLLFKDNKIIRSYKCGLEPFDKITD